MRVWIATQLFRLGYSMRLAGTKVATLALRIAGPGAEIQVRDETRWTLNRPTREEVR